MSYPQIQSTSDFLGALNDEDYFMAQSTQEVGSGLNLRIAHTVANEQENVLRNRNFITFFINGSGSINCCA